ncbi:MAG: hypothetical protein IJE40_05620 [Clostridia bacterium]|nr:hypothetical protein [Clostridia bacterium]
MKILIPILSVVLILISIPYIRFLFKRIQLYIKIKKICTKKKYRFHKNGSLWFLHTQARQNCDFYIETKNEVFAVKLFCVLKRFSNTLIFTDESEYFIRDFTAIPTLSGGYRLPTNGKINKMINYNYRYHYKNEWEIKDPVNVLLINPVPHEIRRQSKNGNETILGNGDPVHGARIYSLSGFLTILERDKNNLQ